MINPYNKLICAIGGLFGASGVACYAAAAHISEYYSSMAPIFLAHATILVILPILNIKSFFSYLALVLIIVGVLLFNLTLGFQLWFGFKLFPYSAPLGGIMIIFGWICFTIGAFCPNGFKRKTD